MAILKDSSEIREAAGIFDELVAQSAVTASKPLYRSPAPARRAPSSSPRSAARPKAAERTPSRPLPEISGADVKFRGDRLESALFGMCKRGGFSGAVLVDSDGLPLAVYNSPIDEASAAAFAMVLGEALEKGSKLMGKTDADNISLDVDYLDKAVVRKFRLKESAYYLMIVCPQDVDERSEVELSVDQVISILRKR